MMMPDGPARRMRLCLPRKPCFYCMRDPSVGVIDFRFRLPRGAVPTLLDSAFGRCSSGLQIQGDTLRLSRLPVPFLFIDDLTFEVVVRVQLSCGSSVRDDSFSFVRAVGTALKSKCRVQRDERFCEGSDSPE